MAKCKRCGKEGHLMELDANGLCAECAPIVRQEIKQLLAEQEERIAKIEAESAHQKKLLDIVLKAEDNYYKDGDVDKAIEALEMAIVESNPPLLGAIPQKVLLLRLYNKSAQNDKALRLLNIFLSNDDPEGPSHDRTRLEIARIMESEGRYVAAIEMHMIRYLYSRANLLDSIVVIKGELEGDYFRENIESCVSKLKWNDDIVSDLVTIVKACITSGDDDPKLAEKKMIEQYRKYLEENKLV